MFYINQKVKNEVVLLIALIKYMCSSDCYKSMISSSIDLAMAIDSKLMSGLDSCHRKYSRQSDQLKIKNINPQKKI